MFCVCVVVISSSTLFTTLLARQALGARSMVDSQDSPLHVSHATMLMVFDDNTLKIQRNELSWIISSVVAEILRSLGGFLFSLGVFWAFWTRDRLK